jgi:spore maturation protein CgeB
MTHVLCVFGEHQYGVPSRGLGTEFQAFVPTLKRLGCQVSHFESRNLTAYQTIDQVNEALLKEIIEKKPDLVLIVPFTHEFWIETIQLIRQMGFATACWTTDDSWKYFEHSRFFAHEYSAITTTYPHILPYYHRAGVKHVLLTQWAARTEELKPPLAAKDCKYDVTFVGAAHGSRKAKVEQLRKMGLNVECFGFGWPSGAVAGDQLAVIMRQSRISLNFANSKGVNQIKARNFEVPGAGGFLLTEFAPELDRHYVFGKEIEVFNNLEELVTIAQRYLKDPELRDRMALAGYERTVREHTYDIRLSELMKFVEAHRPQATMTEDEMWNRFNKLKETAQITPTLRVLRNGLISVCRCVWGAKRGPRAARRITHEVTWRLLGAKAYKANGLASRMFPHE